MNCLPKIPLNRVLVGHHAFLVTDLEEELDYCVEGGRNLLVSSSTLICCSSSYCRLGLVDESLVAK